MTISAGTSQPDGDAYTYEYSSGRCHIGYIANYVEFSIYLDANQTYDFYVSGESDGSDTINASYWSNTMLSSFITDPQGNEVESASYSSHDPSPDIINFHPSASGNYTYTVFDPHTLAGGGRDFYVNINANSLYGATGNNSGGSQDSSLADDSSWPAGTDSYAGGTTYDTNDSSFSGNNNYSGYSGAITDYRFTYYYGNGDHYWGDVIDDGTLGYYVGQTIAGPLPSSYYQITETGQLWPGDMPSEVYVVKYTDSESGQDLYAQHGTTDIVSGSAGLGSEYDYIVNQNGDWTYFDPSTPADYTPYSATSYDNSNTSINSSSTTNGTGSSDYANSVSSYDAWASNIADSLNASNDWGAYNWLSSNLGNFSAWSLAGW